MRLVVTSVIHQILLSLVNSVSHLDEYFNIPLLPTDPMGLKYVSHAHTHTYIQMHQVIHI